MLRGCFRRVRNVDHNSCAVCKGVRTIGDETECALYAIVTMPRRRRDVSSCLHKEKPQQRNAANARERARMRVLSRAFCRLKTTLPWVPPDTKLSKLDTLRLATSYIAHLRAVLSDEAAAAKAAAAAGVDPPHPLTLTWPFSFPRGVPGLHSTDHPRDDLEDDLEDEDEEDWSHSSQDDSVTSSAHDHRNSSFIAHFTDALMDIG